MKRFIRGRNGAWSWVAIVKKARVVVRPGDFGEAAVFEDVGEIFAGIDVADVDFFLIGAAGGKAVGEEFAVGGELSAGEGDGAVGG